jgi:hypothetical protein
MLAAAKPHRERAATVLRIQRLRATACYPLLPPNAQIHRRRAINWS